MEAGNAVGFAAGLFYSGSLGTYLHTFGPFASLWRVFDQLFISLGYVQLDATAWLDLMQRVMAEMNGGTYMPFEELDCYV